MCSALDPRIQVEKVTESVRVDEWAYKLHPFLHSAKNSYTRVFFASGLYLFLSNMRPTVFYFSSRMSGHLSLGLDQQAQGWDLVSLNLLAFACLNEERDYKP